MRLVSGLRKKKINRSLVYFFCKEGGLFIVLPAAVGLTV